MQNASSIRRGATTRSSPVAVAGYVGATTVSPGWASRTDDPYRLPRLRVLGGTDPHTLLELIAGARNDLPPPPEYPPDV